MSGPAGPTEPPWRQSRGYLAEFPPKRWHKVTIALCAAAVYLVGVTDHWWPTPDSALYQGLGRSIVRGEGYRFNGEINTDVTPGMPMILGALRAVFGDGFLAPNLFVTLSGLLSLYLAYLTLARLTDRRMAIAVVLGVAACYRYFHYSHLILTDATFSALFWSFAYVSVRFLQGSFGWLLAAVGLAVAAVTVRAPGLLIIGPFAAGVLLHRDSPAGPLKRAVGAGAVLGGVGALAAALYLLARSVSKATPLYVNPRIMESGVLGRLGRLVDGLYELPAELARMFAGQPHRLLGAALCLLAILGMLSLWRQGRRLSAVTCALCVLGSSFLGGGGAVRARYMMAIFPLFLFVILHGLCRTVELGHRWSTRPTKPKAFLIAVTVFLSCLIAANLPKVLRDGVYYSYAAYTGRYYEVIRDGDFVDLHTVAASLRDRFGPETLIATRGDRASILHFLSERRMVRFLRTERQTAADAEAVYDDLLARTDIEAVVTDAGGTPEPFRRTLEELLSAGGARVIYHGRYCKIHDWPAARGAPRPERGPSP
ncbi:MAG: glycosyltransferase family 39 protein [Phycisphaerae bacterium]